MCARKRTYEQEEGTIEMEDTMDVTQEPEVKDPPAPKKAEEQTVDPSIFSPFDPRSPYHETYLRGGLEAVAEESKPVKE